MLGGGLQVFNALPAPAVITSVDFHCESNNRAHRTSEITGRQLIVRRGQAFLLTLEMTKPFTTRDPLSLTVETGSSPSATGCHDHTVQTSSLNPPVSPPGSAPSEQRGTRCEFGNPSPMYARDAKAIWKYIVDRSADLQSGVVTLSVTPPADAPVGKYSLSASIPGERRSVGTLVVLFNPWCSGKARRAAPVETTWIRAFAGSHTLYWLQMTGCIFMTRGRGKNMSWRNRGSSIKGRRPIPAP